MRIDIYNYIIENLKLKLNFKSNNTKYSVKTIFDSIIFILKNGLSWNCSIVINNIIVKTNSIYKHFVFLTNIFFFQKLIAKLNRKFYKKEMKESKYSSVDSTFIANKKCKKYGIKRNPYKSSKFGYKVSVITNQYNLPIDILFAGGNKNDLKLLLRQLKRKVTKKYLKNQFLLADKGYRSRPVQLQLLQNRIYILTPKQNSFYPNAEYKTIYKNRVYVEHFFGKIKNYRRIAFNYERTVKNFRSFVYLSIVQLYIVGCLGHLKI